MKIGAALAVALALLTFRQTAVWESEETLWTHALRVAPDRPRPWVNLGVERIKHEDYATARALFDHALVLPMSTFEEAWLTDVIEANRAVIDIREGRLWHARQRLMGAPWSSRRSQVCLQFKTVCASDAWR